MWVAPSDSSPDKRKGKKESFAPPSFGRGHLAFSLTGKFAYTLQLLLLIPLLMLKPTSLSLQQGLKIRDFPGILQAFSIRLGMCVQPHGSQHLHPEMVIIGILQLYCVSQSNKSSFNKYSLY